VKTALVEIPSATHRVRDRLPQENRARADVRDFVRDIKALGKDGEAILSGNVWQASQGAREGGVNVLTPARCFSISSTGILTKSLSILGAQATLRRFL